MLDYYFAKVGDTYSFKDLEIKVISTGSIGNAFYDATNKFLFDLGGRVKQSTVIKECLGVKYLFLTHIHGDHVKLSTIKKVVDNNPFIKIVSHKHVFEKYPELKDYKCIELNDGDSIYVNDLKITGYLGEHSVPVMYFSVENNDTGEGIYVFSTDNKDLSQLTKRYRYLFIEGNNDEDVVNRLFDKVEEVLSDFVDEETRREYNVLYSRLNGSEAHCSIQSAITQMHQLSYSTTFVLLLHASETLIDYEKYLDMG